MISFLNGVANLIRAKNYEGALKSLEEYKPNLNSINNPRLLTPYYFRLALCHFHLKHYQECIDSGSNVNLNLLKEVVEQNFLIGIVSYSLVYFQRDEQALAYLNNLQESDSIPTLNARLLKATILLKQEEYEDVVSCLSRIDLEKIAPHIDMIIEFHLMNGIAFSKLGHLQTSKEHFSTIFESDKLNSIDLVSDKERLHKAFNQYFDLLIKDKEFNKALQIVEIYRETFQESTQKSLEYHFMQGCIYYAMNIAHPSDASQNSFNELFKSFQAIYGSMNDQDRTSNIHEMYVQMLFKKLHMAISSEPLVEVDACEIANTLKSPQLKTQNLSDELKFNKQCAKLVFHYRLKDPKLEKTKKKIQKTISELKPEQKFLAVRVAEKWIDILDKSSDSVMTKFSKLF